MNTMTPYKFVPYDTVIQRALHWWHVYRRRGAGKMPFLQWFKWVICGGCDV